MDYYMGYVRNEKGMSTALEKFALIESVEDTIMAKNLHELLRAHEAMHLLRTCRLTTLATRERRETGRSVYRRTDYPDMDPSLNKLLILEKDAYGPKAFWAGQPARKRPRAGCGPFPAATGPPKAPAATEPFF